VCAGCRVLKGAGCGICRVQGLVDHGFRGDASVLSLKELRCQG
jgi:hypothetical protein